MAVTAVVLCAAATEALKSVGNLADCTLMYADGSGHKCIAIKVSKAIIAAHSKVLGYARYQSLHLLFTCRTAMSCWLHDFLKPPALGSTVSAWCSLYIAFSQTT